MVLEVRLTENFRDWLQGLRDLEARRSMAIRLTRLEAGNFGDVKYFDGIGELRITYGPGYRLYFVRRGTVLVVMLCGGDKASQQRDIKRARQIAAELEV